jgi:Tfp pilus assembly protein PilF
MVALILGAGLASGCAAVNSAPVAAGLAKQGKAALDPGGPSLAAGATLQETMRAVRHLSARPVTKESAGTRAESVDPQLAAALRLATANPSPQHHVQVAHEYLRLRILDTAYTFANRAVLQKPRLAEAHELLARIWRDWGMPDLAIGPASRAAYFDPASASAQNTLGTVLDALGQHAEARRAFARAVALDASASWALNNLCFVELRTGGLLEARKHCEAALEVDPTMTAARNNLALTFVAAGDDTAAGQAFQAAGNPARAAYNRGIVHMAGRDYIKAAEDFEEAIAARPEFSKAKARAHEARMLAITSVHD